MNNLLITYFGDDFTGSTDAMESLSKAGAQNVLFTRPPSPEMLSQYQGLQAVGVAGGTRFLPPGSMEIELEETFTALRDLQPRHLHYKVCSTFDSSPEIGSIGCAIEVGQRIVGSRYVPLLVGSPVLGRYCLFGNLFAATGIGCEGEVFRLDRHPTASRHPTTPMDESDLRAHLGKQTNVSVALFDLLKLELPAEERVGELNQLIDAGADAVLFDVMYDHQLSLIGSLIDSDSNDMQTQFSVGSSSIESALCAHWTGSRILTPNENWAAPEQVTQVLVVSGSCSPITRSQIDWAANNGFVEVKLDTPSIAASEGSSQSIRHPASQVIELLKSGKSVVAHTSRGNNDPRISATMDVLAKWETDRSTRGSLSAQVLGVALGRLVSMVLEKTTVRRLCVAGGDTASFVAQAMGIEAIEMICPLAPGAPLCSVKAPNSPADGLQISFKGGQVGKDDFFGSLLKGSV